MGADGGAHDDLPPEDLAMVIPFVCTESTGGPFEDRAFAAGWQLGVLSTTLALRSTSVYQQAMYAELHEQADLVAMAEGFLLVKLHEQAGWELLRFVRSFVDAAVGVTGG